MRIILIALLFSSYLANGQTDTLQVMVKDIDSSGKVTVSTNIKQTIATKLTIDDSVTFSTKAYRQKAVDSLNALLAGKQNSLGFTPLNPANNLSDLGSASTARTNLGVNTTANISASTNKNFVTDAQLTVIGNTSGTNTGDNAANTTYANDYRAANFVAGTNYLAPNGNGSALTGLTESQITNLVNDLAGKQATLVSGSNIKTVNGNSLLGSTDIVTTRKVASADIAATSSATGTTTLFTPTASGMYRLSVYMKITTTGTSPVAGPVTITYTDADGSVAQSHTMLLQSVTGTVVTTTVNNSTTTGTVNGSMIFNAKTGVAITYAIAVSGTFGAGRYTAHITLEQL